jgi:protein subunit release factor B
MTLENLKSHTKIIFYKSSGPGGQRKNKKETAVRLVHKPTGVTVVATEHRYQSENLKLAFRRLEEKIKRLCRKPRPRIPGATTISTIERRLEQKKVRAKKKALRKKIDYLEEFF